MKHLLILLLTGLLLASCSTEEKEQNRDVVIPAKDMHTGIRRPLLVDSVYNIYHKGDTVWTYEGRITTHTWPISFYYGQTTYDLFIIE